MSVSSTSREAIRGADAEIPRDPKPVKSVKRANQVSPSLPGPIRGFAVDADALRATNFAQIIQKSTLNNNFLKLVCNTQENISFWGSRYITISMLIGGIRVKGTAHIDALATRVIKLVQEHKFEYSQEERSIGSLISRKIDQLYDANDRRLNNRNFLTRVLYVLRVFFKCFNFRNVSITRWDWREEEGEFEFCNIFKYYTKAQYKKEFGTFPGRFEANYGLRRQTKDLFLPPNES
ncbi:MAG: hypothetical protein KR126chlam4_01065 [Candidatus Anoxychlamydiales bacterium]|nr:hypothetical protein [Candidatus Anoxychlamydiales bacterium]